MLEKMSDFFEARLDGYDEHMMTNIESANEFYPFTAKQLPKTPFTSPLLKASFFAYPVNDIFKMYFSAFGYTFVNIV